MCRFLHTESPASISALTKRRSVQGIGDHGNALMVIINFKEQLCSSESMMPRMRIFAIAAYAMRGEQLSSPIEHETEPDDGGVKVTRASTDSLERSFRWRRSRVGRVTGLEELMYVPTRIFNAFVLHRDID
ncbi:unnamed protein product [Somion occarium]|uniref:Uncharacterized protein n=1 Tax=Somion occarium TaxID=3059160 RepID=A0ABP1E3Y5_9APHY